jgi:pimeloyl-ACP methyl ester carboxylesterase
MNKFLLYQNKKIFYSITGTGKPVILIHGFGEEAAIWNNQVAFLKNKFQLIIPDLPGSGQSEMIDDMSMEGMAEVIKCIYVMESHSSVFQKEELTQSYSKDPLSEGFREAVLIGHSMGGYIALAFAERYPERISAFGLFHSSAFADSEEKKVTRRKGIEFIQQNGAFEFLKTATPNLFSPITKNKKPELIDEQVARLHNFSPITLVSYYEAMMQRPDRTEILRKAIVPVLFIMGKYDAAVPVEDGLKQCHLPEKSYIHILQESGHMGMLEEPNKSNLILDKFLQEL